jgi:hypothetical protein
MAVPYNNKAPGQSGKNGGNSMGARRLQATLRRIGGVILGVAGVALVVRVLPLYLWPLVLGVVLIWAGWQLYIYDRSYW